MKDGRQLRCRAGDEACYQPSKEKTLKMLSENIAQMAHPDAAQRVVDEIEMLNEKQ